MLNAGYRRFSCSCCQDLSELGFIPVYVEDGQPKRWRDIFEKLGLPSMSSQIENVRETLPEDLWVKVSR